MTERSLEETMSRLYDACIDCMRSTPLVIWQIWSAPFVGIGATLWRLLKYLFELVVSVSKSFYYVIRDLCFYLSAIVTRTLVTIPFTVFLFFFSFAIALFLSPFIMTIDRKARKNTK